MNTAGRRKKVYWVEVLENGQTKIVPHTGKALYKFLSREDVRTFKDELVLNNHGRKFRIVKETTITEPEKWFGIEKKKK